MPLETSGLIGQLDIDVDDNSKSDCQMPLETAEFTAQWPIVS